MNRLFYTPLLILVVIQATIAGEPQQAKMTAGEYAVFAIAERPRTIASICASKAPGMKDDFDEAIAELQFRVERAAKSLLATETFSSLNHAAAPKVMMDAMGAETEKQKALYKDVDPMMDCPKFLANIRRIDGEFLEAGVAQTLAGMKTLLAAEKAGMIK
jgi:hypothetical protein